jgi:hypothetical protein
MIIIIIIMSVWWDYVSEMWPPTGLLFIPRAVYEHGEQLWNDIDTTKVIVNHSSLEILPAVI